MGPVRDETSSRAIVNGSLIGLILGQLEPKKSDLTIASGSWTGLISGQSESRESRSVHIKPVK